MRAVLPLRQERVTACQKRGIPSLTSAETVHAYVSCVFTSTAFDDSKLPSQWRDGILSRLQRTPSSSPTARDLPRRDSLSYQACRSSSIRSEPRPSLARPNSGRRFPFSAQLPGSSTHPDPLLTLPARSAPHPAFRTAEPATSAARVRLLSAISPADPLTSS